tara:strand:- start:195 stop:371 length:177 start_codon:yes stop_codon:yes gene_type:complete
MNGKVAVCAFRRALNKGEIDGKKAYCRASRPVCGTFPQLKDFEALFAYFNQLFAEQTG